MKAKSKNTLFNFIATIVITTNCYAQNNIELLNQAIREDSSSINTLALYPKNIRAMVYEVCVTPSVLVKMTVIQNNSKEQFKNILSIYSKEEQKNIWDLTRYPDLIKKLVKDGKRKENKIDAILKDYPKDIHETAKTLGKNYYDVLKKIDDLNNETAKSFQLLIKEYPITTQNAITELIKYPEIISLLNENMRTSVMIGDVYKNAPQILTKKMDSLNIELARQNTKELEEWKDGLEKNSEAKKEFEESSKEYAKSKGYKEEDLTITETRVVTEYVVYPYPYWYGYPWWWDQPYWYPYPYWYDWGYYYGPHGFVFIGFPSWYYMHWYFFNEHHHYNYSHFSDYCVGHYYGHRKNYSSVNRNAERWIRTKENNLPANYFNADPQRPDRIKELGKFEMDYNQQRKDATDKNITRKQFLETNAVKYPTISRVLGEDKQSLERNKLPRIDEKKDIQIRKEPMEREVETIPKQKPPSMEKPKEQKRVNPPLIEKPKQPIPKIPSPQIQKPKPAPIPKPIPKSEKKNVPPRK